MLAGMATPPQVIVAANDDMALGAIEAVKARNLKGVVIIGFDALPEALAKVRDGEMTATIEQFPGKQSAWGVQLVSDFIKSGKKPSQQVNLITPAAITKDNLKDARTPRRSQMTRAVERARRRRRVPRQSAHPRASRPECPARRRRRPPLAAGRIARSSR